MSNETSLRARFAALGVTPPFRADDGELIDATLYTIALLLPDQFDDKRIAPLTALIAEALNRAIAADEAKE
jgi:hypothetical protein